MIPIDVINYIDRTPDVCFQVYNIRNLKAQFSLHKGNNNYLFRSCYGIDVLSKPEAIKMLDELNKFVEQKRFSSFRIVEE